MMGDVSSNGKNAYGKGVWLPRRVQVRVQLASIDEIASQIKHQGGSDQQAEYLAMIIRRGAERDLAGENGDPNELGPPPHYVPVQDDDGSRFVVWVTKQA